METIIYKGVTITKVNHYYVFTSPVDGCVHSNTNLHFAKVLIGRILKSIKN